MGDSGTTFMIEDSVVSDDRPTRKANDAEREAQIDEIIARLERLEIEAARLRQLAARLKTAREGANPAASPSSEG
jgi:hypothetical protein